MDEYRDTSNAGRMVDVRTVRKDGDYGWIGNHRDNSVRDPGREGSGRNDMTTAAEAARIGGSRRIFLAVLWKEWVARKQTGSGGE